MTAHLEVLHFLPPIRAVDLWVYKLYGSLYSLDRGVLLFDLFPPAVFGHGAKLNFLFLHLEVMMDTPRRVPPIEILSCASSDEL